MISNETSGIAEFRTMRGTRDMDYVWCPLREEGLFNFTDDQLVAVRSSAESFFQRDTWQHANDGRIMKFVIAWKHNPNIFLGMRYFDGNLMVI